MTPLQVALALAGSGAAVLVLRWLVRLWHAEWRALWDSIDRDERERRAWRREW